MIRPTARTLRFALIVGLIIGLGGCTNLPYYAQAVGGHLEVMHRSRPITTIIADPGTDQALRHSLNRVVLLREFASRELKLPDNQSYTSYADLNRPYVVWNVFASPELSLNLKQWCFIQAGCVSYRGFFSQASAEHYAETLRNEGYDVYVGGIRAYSTLGWFSDPVLNTFLGYSEMELARLIFHELAHQVVFVPNDSVFNESFATAVEREGIRRWFASRGMSSEQASVTSRQERETVFTRLILNHRKRLEALFASDLGDADKRAAKAHIFAELREAFAQLKAVKPEFSSYDRWFAQSLNNALLATVSVYTHWLPAFQALLAQQNYDMDHFFTAVREISKLPQDERAAALQAAAGNNRHWELVER